MQSIISTFVFNKGLWGFNKTICELFKLLLAKLRTLLKGSLIYGQHRICTVKTRISRLILFWTTPETILKRTSS